MQDKFVKILTELLYSLPESDTCEWCGLEMCKPTCIRVRALTLLEELAEQKLSKSLPLPPPPPSNETTTKGKPLPIKKSCPVCSSETFPRKGFHFDHEKRCCKCSWIGEIK